MHCLLGNRRIVLWEGIVKSFAQYSSQSRNVDPHQSQYFGYEKVESSDEKTAKVRAVFTNVAQRYDLMNDVMSAGMHRAWKDYFVRRLWSIITPNSRIIDVAGGTGDIAFRFVDRLRHGIPRGDSKITVVDINEQMLDVGRQRIEEKGEDGAKKNPFLNWICADAERLDTFPDNSFDLYTIAFGIRNCAHIDKVLSEAFRVLRPGGYFSCLEFSPRLECPSLQRLYNLYSLRLIPVLGQLLAGDFHSYRYLVESIRMFPTPEEFANQISSAGFKRVCWEPLSAGICVIHTAICPPNGD